MQQLRDKVRTLLESQTVQVVLGYQAGSAAGRARAVFVRKPEQAAVLVLDESCRQNLAVYLTKLEVKKLGKLAMVARPAALRTMLQLAAENQLADGEVLAVAVADGGGQVRELSTLKEIEEFLAGTSAEPQSEELARLRAMSPAERWSFWQEHLSRCLKCYACRAACPLCYCSKCVVECNQPQWVSVPPHALGNLEWHVVRAMHLAGRCIGCGHCASACPVDIPLDLLTQALTEKIQTEFDQQPGSSATYPYALSMFRPEDKEDFIK